VCALAPASAVWGPALLALGRAATGLGAGAGVVAILVFAFAAVPAASRPLASALVWSGMGFALVLAGLWAELLVETAIGWRACFGLSALLGAAIAVVFPPGNPAIAHAAGAPSPAHFGPSHIMQGRWVFLLAAYFMFGAGYIAYATFAGTRLAAGSASMPVVSAMWMAFGAAMVAGMALSVPVLRLEGHTKLALAGALLAGALGALGSWSDAASAATAGALLVGLGLATPTIVSAYARERCSEAQYPQAFSYATAAMGIGQLLGPVAGGALADRFGVAAVPLFAFAAYGLGALLAAIDAMATARAARG
jgi:predicted MFS family arabinose efflux permease